ncbi:hypothetical protein HanXRQr2_Chr04g0141431 [Helianthus annuus]|uniref:Uncharacterized protein n=1 Tax=Helianthus annuus TaxID=4232 RepID=A0A9K3J442_HELAN|nr:hypothetical protein HanXRQr2_Chr04g0141431 [Helianthus annuus]
MQIKNHITFDNINFDSFDYPLGFLCSEFGFKVRLQFYKSLTFSFLHYISISSTSLVMNSRKVI